MSNTCSQVNFQRSNDSLDLSIIITTSANPSNPSTEMIEKMLNSLSLLSADLNKCKIFIVMDGYKLLQNDSKKPEIKSGKLSFAGAKLYDEYKDNLRVLIKKLNTCGQVNSVSNITLIELEKRHGFAGAVYNTLKNHIATTNVMVCQHDWIFVKELGTGVLSTLLKLLNDKNENINYIGFQAPSTIGYHKSEREYKSKHILAKTYKNIVLEPLYFWYDRNHIVRRDFYLNNVFEKYPKLKTTSFLEDTFGSMQLDDIRKDKSQETFNKYGCYLYYPDNGSTVYVVHVHGRKYLTDEQRNLIFHDQLLLKKSH
jgi:hypothetical protein